MTRGYEEETESKGSSFFKRPGPRAHDIERTRISSLPESKVSYTTVSNCVYLILHIPVYLNTISENAWTAKHYSLPCLWHLASTAVSTTKTSSQT